MKRFLTLFFLTLTLAAMAQERENIWKDSSKKAWIEWYDAPANPNGGCMILISGGAYNGLVDTGLIRQWKERFTELGFQCVNLCYRTPRPEGLPVYQYAWEDGQRAVRMIRSEAVKRGFDPEKIGSISMSAGSHLNLLLATSSQTPAYVAQDKLDKVPCHINWAIVNAPAYVLTDSNNGDPNTMQGYGPGIQIDSIFKFDSKTCPMSLHHGGNDIYSPNASTQVYRQLRRMNIPSEVHLYPDKGHGAFGLERAVEFMTQMGYCGPLAKEESLVERYSKVEPEVDVIREDVWPEGKTPDFNEHQKVPYIEWHIPAHRTTDAIQIVYSGGGYNNNNVHGFEVMPACRYLNSLGMTVVTLMYRTPRPKGLEKHVTAWQDLQRTIRIVRSEAAARGLDPDRIGIMGGSAGGHLTLMGVTSSRHQSYAPIDDIDKISCKVQWGVGIYPAYALTDGIDCMNTEKGNSDSNVLVPEFSFDLDTAPMVMVHGDADGYAAMASVKVWEKMRAMGIQSEVHTLATREHCFQMNASPGTGSYTHLERIWEFLTEKGFNK